MRLYYAPGTISVAVAITLYEAGAEFELRKVDFKAAEQTKPDYLQINPKGRVPVLATGGVYLTETGAILDYIAATHPNAGLVPSEPTDAARMRSVMYYLASTMHVNHAHRVRGSRWADLLESHADMAAKVPETMSASAAFLEAECQLSPYVLGSDFSLADPYTFVVCNWLGGDGVDIGDYPKLSRFMAKMRERASVQRVIDEGVLPS